MTVPSMADRVAAAVNVADGGGFVVVPLGVTVFRNPVARAASVGSSGCACRGKPSRRPRNPSAATPARTRRRNARKRQARPSALLSDAWRSDSAVGWFTLPRLRARLGPLRLYPACQSDTLCPNGGVSSLAGMQGRCLQPACLEARPSGPDGSRWPFPQPTLRSKYSNLERARQFSIRAGSSQRAAAARTGSPNA